MSFRQSTIRKIAPVLQVCLIDNPAPTDLLGTQATLSDDATSTNPPETISAIPIVKVVDDDIPSLGSPSFGTGVHGNIPGPLDARERLVGESLPTFPTLPVPEGVLVRVRYDAGRKRDRKLMGNSA